MKEEERRRKKNEVQERKSELKKSKLKGKQERGKSRVEMVKRNEAAGCAEEAGTWKNKM